MHSDLKENATASCLCGKVHMFSPAIYAQLQDGASKIDVNICHCSQCRQWVGGPFMVVNAGEGIEISGDEHVMRYDSSHWAQRGFCQSCGTSLFYYLKAKDAYMICAGTFKHLDFTMTSQIFIDEKPSYYCFANETAMMTGNDVKKMMEG